MPINNSPEPAPSAAPEAPPGPAANATPAKDRGAKRWFSLRGGERAKQFALNLKADARWLKQFLHGGK